MINILIPACGQNDSYEGSYYPQNIVEIVGKPMIQYIIENYETLENAQFIFCFFRKECDTFHTDKIVTMLTSGRCNIVKIENVTRGALCTALLAAEYVDNDNELIIANNNQIIDVDILEAVSFFREKRVDGGVICFDSVYPRWSYLRIAGDKVIETAEKHPLSNYAIAGFYYFSQGADFVKAAKMVIKKRETYNGRYFLSSSINELILSQKEVGFYQIPSENYHSFYSLDKVSEFVKGVIK